MDVLSRRERSDGRTRRWLLAVAFGLVVLASSPWLEVGQSTVPGAPLVLFGLAAHGGTDSDREPSLDRLTTELEAFVSRLRVDVAEGKRFAVADADEADDAGEVDESIRDCAARIRSLTVEIANDGDDDDDVAELAETVDELTATIVERDRQFDERERALRTANERLEAAIEASPTALVGVDLEGTVEVWNPAAERTFGWTAAEVRGDQLPIIPDDRVDEVDGFRTRLEAGEAITRVETKRRRKDDSLIDVSLSKAPIRDANGEIVGAMAALEDITERKNRERRLEATSARLEALFDRSPDMIDVLDPEGTIVETNRRLRDELGYDEGELIGTKIWNHDPSFDEAAVDSLLGDLDVDERRRFEGEFERADGSTFPVEVHCIHLSIAGRTRILSIARDISGRTERERSLRETSRRLELALEGTNTGVWEWNVETDEIVWNETLERLLGLEPGSFDGTYEAFKARVHPEDRSRVEAALERAVTEGERYETSFRMRHADGDWRWAGVRGRLVDDEAETRILGIYTDITDRKENERRLQRRERELQRYAEYTNDVLDAVDDVFYVFDRDGDLQRWNQSLLDSTSYTEADVREMTVLEFFDDDNRPIIAEAIEDVFETGETRVEASVLTADGEQIPYEFVATSLENLDGESVVAGIGRDISERRAKERELERYREFTGDMLDAIDDVFYVLDEDGELLRWNDTVVEVSGYTEDEIASMHTLEFFPEEDQPAIRRSVEEAFETGDTRVEADYLTKDGERIPYEFVATRVEDPDGDPVEVGIGRDISARKRYERELERTTELLTQSQQLANVGAWELDVRDGTYVHWTDEVARIHGLDSADDIGLEGALEYYHPEDRPEVRQAIDRAIDEGEPYQLELRLLPEGDDDVRWVRTIGEPIVEDDDVVRIVGSIQEITDRKRRERDLRETKRRLELALEGTNTGIWELNVETNELFWSETLERLVGLEPGSFGGTYEVFRERVHPDDLPVIEPELERAIENDEMYRRGFRLRHEDGGWIWVGARARLVTDEQGDRWMVGINNDITDRKRRERELERYETIIQAIGDPVYTLDPEGNIQFVNDAIESLAGYEPSELVGEAVTTVVSEADFERARELVRELRREDKRYETLEVDLETADGDVIEAENHMALLPSDNSRFAGTAGVIRDITERKERERELERTTDFLERVQRLANVGGWELDVDAEPRTAIWTDEMYRIHDLSPDVDPDLETTIQCFHPEDRPFVRDRLTAAIETETGYDLEARIQPDEGATRWVRAISEPIHGPDGELVAYRGAVQDITDRKQRELSLESLHETARGLLNAETAGTIADLVTDTAADLLESDRASAAVYLLEDDTNRFEPVASTPDFGPSSGDEIPSVAVGDSDSVLWTTYVAGTQTVVDDAATGERSPLFDGDAPGGLLVPIGDHGVFVLVAPPSTIDDESRQLFETLVATTEAAFDRLESEATLRERDAELETRNRRLRRQIQITDIIRRIDQSLIGADSRGEIEQNVPERLVEADDISFAWIGDVGAGGTALEARSWAGDEPTYLDTHEFDLEGESAEPAVKTARSATPTVVENAVAELQAEPWRRVAVDAGFQSAIAVPLQFEEYSYGVLAVYADEPDAFGDLERTVFAELGEGIANAINAAETQEALHAETLVELTVTLEGDDFLSRLATATGATVSYEGLGANTDSETVLFFETRGASTADVDDVLAELVSVADYRLVSDAEEGCLFEATITGDTVASRLVRHGGSPRSITADGERTTVAVDVPTTTDVREFVEMLADQYAEVELQSRRQVSREMQTRQELVTALFEDLTDRQLEVLRTAYLAGFFEWPRESTGEEIAEMLEVTQPTVNRHLRIGQQRLFSQLFGSEALSFADAS